MAVPTWYSLKGAMVEKSSIARKVKEFRESKGLSQQELAVKAGLSISEVAQIEQGKKADLRMSTVIALAKALEIDVGQLLPAE
jgi:transcriptional regulator with XRE-family HTH domain